MRRFLTINLIFLILIHSAAVSVAGQRGVSVPTEDQVKVAMIYNLAKFVSWPEVALPTEQATLLICYLGSSPMTEELYLLQDKTVKNRKLVIKEVTRVEALGPCHILIVGPEFKNQIDLKDEQTRWPGIFTVSETPDFAKQGGMVEFFTKDDRVRFRINHGAVRAAQLGISSQVLQLAVEVIE